MQVDSSLTEQMQGSAFIKERLLQLAKVEWGAPSLLQAMLHVLAKALEVCKFAKVFYFVSGLDAPLEVRGQM